MAATIPSASLLLIAWTLGGLLALTGGLTYGEMGAMFPRSGGLYVFLREAYGPFIAFLYGWVALTVVLAAASPPWRWASPSTSAISSRRCRRPRARRHPDGARAEWRADRLGRPDRRGRGHRDARAINYVGVRSGNLVNATLTVAKVAGLAALPVMALAVQRVEPSLTPIVPPISHAGGCVRHRDDRGPVDL